MMRSCAALLIATACTSAAAAEDSAQFDLKCTGESDTYINAQGPTKAAWAETYRVDLAEQSYCAGACSEVLPIYSISPDQIQLNDLPFTQLNRSTGEIRGVTHDSSGGVVMTIFTGACSKQPFSGFPRKF
jgi:hypothetical protein